MLLLVLAGNHAQSQSDTKLTKSINKAYKVPKDITVDVSNKYGRVAVKSWAKDSVLISVEITAYAKDSRSTQKLMERVEIDFSNLGPFLTVETVLDRGSGTFKELLNTVGDVSKTVLSSNKLTIDYEITLPEGASLFLDNRFGNVFIADHGGPIKLTLAHGDLKANELKGKSIVDLSFGKANIRRVHDVELTLKAAQVDIQQAKGIILQSMTSELRVESALSARVDSRNDKLNFQKIGWISGKGMFTDWTLGEIQENLDLEVNYGQVILHSLNKDFAKVRLASKYTDLDVTMDPASWVNLDIKAEQDKIYIPGNWIPMLTNSPVAGKEGYIQLSGQVGRTNDKQGIMQLDLQGASVTLRYMEALPFTKN
tara:strand:- start:2797 stop:3903 length:1107 start_codon:yes stop_codon:yes gene_type:complete